MLNFEIHHNDVILHLICSTSVRSRLTSFLGCSFIYSDYINCAEGLAHLCFSLKNCWMIGKKNLQKRQSQTVENVTLMLKSVLIFLVSKIANHTTCVIVYHAQCSEQWRRNRSGCSGFGRYNFQPIALTFYSCAVSSMQHRLRTTTRYNSVCTKHGNVIHSWGKKQLYFAMY